MYNWPIIFGRTDTMKIVNWHYEHTFETYILKHTFQMTNYHYWPKEILESLTLWVLIPRARPCEQSSALQCFKRIANAIGVANALQKPFHTLQVRCQCVTFLIVPKKVELCNSIFLAPLKIEVFPFFSWGHLRKLWAIRGQMGPRINLMPKKCFVLPDLIRTCKIF